MAIDKIINFWFADDVRAKWFVKDKAFDQHLKQEFELMHLAAHSGKYAQWQLSASGCLALCLLLDQIPRNIFRDTARAYASDGFALKVVKHALAKGFDQQLSPAEKTFIYMPLMHSEDLADQNLCCDLFKQLNGNSDKFAELHRDIIKRFKRFPHRNKILGRVSSKQEKEFLLQPNSSF